EIDHSPCKAAQIQLPGKWPVAIRARLADAERRHRAGEIFDLGNVTGFEILLAERRDRLRDGLDFFLTPAGGDDNLLHAARRRLALIAVLCIRKWRGADRCEHAERYRR